MVVHVELFVDQFCHALGSPQIGFVATLFRSREQVLFQPRLLPWGQPRLASGATRLAQSALAALPFQRRPARYALPPHA